MNRSSTRPWLSLFCILVACGGQSVSPEIDVGPRDASEVRDAQDVADVSPGVIDVGPGDASEVPDAQGVTDVSPGVTRCSLPVAVLDAPATEVDRVAFARAERTFVMVTSVPSGALTVQTFDEVWRRIGAPAALRSAPSNTAFSTDRPTVFFDGARGAIAFGTVAHEVILGSDRRVSAARTMQTETSVASILGAWPRTDARGERRFTVVTDDTSVWNASSSQLIRSFVPSTPVNLVSSSVVLHQLEDHFTAYERIMRGRFDNEVRIRRYTATAGAVRSTSERLDTGTLIGEPEVIGDRIARLNFRSSTDGSNSLTYVEDAREDGSERSRNVLIAGGTVTSGRIAVRPGSTRTEDVFLAWTQVGADTPSQSRLIVKFGVNSNWFPVYDSPQHLTVHGAWIEPSGARAWIVYGENDLTAMPPRRLFVRCVDH